MITGRGEENQAKMGEKMRTQKAIQIARREWENIRSSLEMCGDIGEFDSKNHVSSISTLISSDLLLFRNLIEMENKLPTYGYFTPEAAYVFTAFASSAGERLGLMGRLAQTFGSGYSLVRTGCLDPKRTEKQHLEQMVFFKLFFPLGGGFNWKFNSSLVKVKLKTVFDRFVAWQNAPRSYVQGLMDYKAQLELSSADDCPESSVQFTQGSTR
jgi:hypothetical protein